MRARIAPEVSVVIPTRDRAKWLRRALATALAQEGVELEVIVVHDGPDTGGLQPAKEGQDSRVRALELQSPQGMAAARNAGIDVAIGTWVAFLDDDDLWSPQKLRRQLDAAGDRAGFVYAGAVSVDEDARVVARSLAPDPSTLHSELRRWNVVPAGSSNVLIRLAAIKEAGGFDVRFRHLADWDAWIRVTANVPAVALDSVDVAYLLHHEASSSRPAREFEEEFGLLMAKHGSDESNGFDEIAFLRWLAGRQTFAGQGRTAASILVRVAWMDRSPVELLRAARVLMHIPSLRRKPLSPEPWIQPVRNS